MFASNVIQNDEPIFLDILQPPKAPATKIPGELPPVHELPSVPVDMLPLGVEMNFKTRVVHEMAIDFAGKLRLSAARVPKQAEPVWASKVDLGSELGHSVKYSAVLRCRLVKPASPLEHPPGLLDFCRDERVLRWRCLRCGQNAWHQLVHSLD